MKFLKKIILTTLFVVSPILFINAQTSGNGGSIPWVVLTNEYDTSPFNDTTLVDVYFDGSDYSGTVTSVQFKVGYDGNAFDSVYKVVHNLSNDYLLSYNDNQSSNEVLISLVYTGSSSNTSIPDTAFVTIKLDNIPNSLLYSNEQNLQSLYMNYIEITQLYKRCFPIILLKHQVLDIMKWFIMSISMDI